MRDQYTTLPDIANRPSICGSIVEWTGREPIASPVRKLVHEVFDGFESGSIQQIIYQIGNRMLEEFASIDEVNLKANNRTWNITWNRAIPWVSTPMRALLLVVWVCR